MFNYDNVLSSLGEFGSYQKKLCFYTFLLSMPFGIHLTSSVFNNVTPNFRCAVPGLANDSYAILDSHHQSLVEAYIPKDQDGEHYSQCEIYDPERTSPSSRQLASEENSTTIPTISCHRWVYEDDGVFSQIVDFDLVCDRAIYKAHGNLMLLMGLLVGSLLGGTLSDYFGRKKTLFGGVILQNVIASLMALAPSMHFVLAVRLLVALMSILCYMPAFVMLAEVVGVSKRSIATMATMLGYAAGLFLMTFVQYMFTDWRTAQLVQSLPLLAFGGFWCLIQESPRWLITKNRTQEAKDVITYIARVNKASLPQEMEFMGDAVMLKSDEEMHNGDVAVTSTSKELKIWHICSHRKMVVRMSILCFSWITVNMVYFGMVLGVGDLIEGDIYINFTLQSIMECISYGLCAVILERMGRKTIFCSSMAISGLATIGIGIIVLAKKDLQWMSISLYCLGKLCISMAFALIYIMTTEMLPTQIRNSGLGFCAFVARFSGIVSPYIVSASLLIPGPFGKAFPVLIFGIFSLAAGLSAMLLPETRNAELPETLDDDPIPKTKAHGKFKNHNKEKQFNKSGLK